MRNVPVVIPSGLLQTHVELYKGMDIMTTGCHRNRECKQLGCVTFAEQTTHFLCIVYWMQSPTAITHGAITAVVHLEAMIGINNCFCGDIMFAIYFNPTMVTVL